MSLNAEEKKAEQKKYYVRLNEILVKLQDREITQNAAENQVIQLNNEFPSELTKASPSIVDAMMDEDVNFYEGSMC